MSKQFPTSPYFDTYDAQQNFMKVLFRPGVAVQVRELNTAQSILQGQIESVGNHLFKEGSMVVPGYISSQNKVDCIKLQTTNALSEKVSLFLGDFVDTVITGDVSGAKALVVHSVQEVDSDYNTLYIKYIKSGSTSVKFIEDENISNDADSPISATTIDASCNSVGSIASIQNGIYFIKGYFVTVLKETIVLDKYGVTPSYRVGLNVVENIVTADDDATLNDNAIGSYNYYAPGANRYQIATNLVKLSLDDDTAVNFVELLRVNLGVTELKVVTTDYAIIEETLARRTYDESGDYTVKPFKLQIQEDRTNDRDVRTDNTPYIIGDVIEYTTGGTTYTYECIVGGTSYSTPPTYITTFGTFTDGGVTWQYTETPKYNLGVNYDGVESKLDVAIEGGKAYVRGYEIEKLGKTFVKLDKPRTYSRVNGANSTVNVGNYFKIKNIKSIPEINFAIVDLYDEYNTTPGSANGTKVGTAIVASIEKDDVVSGEYKMFVFNMVLISGKTFRDVRQVYYNNGTLAVDFTADIVGNNIRQVGSISSSSTAITGVGTVFTSDLMVGDFITIDGTNYYRVTVITNDRSLTLASAPSAITGAAFYVRRSAFYEPNKTAYLVPFANSFIRNVKSADDVSNDTQYTITRKFQTLTSNGSGVITITLTTPGESFESIGNATNYMFMNNTTGVIKTPTLAVNSDSTVLTASVLDNTTPYNVLVSISKIATQRTKAISLVTKDVTTAAGVKAAIITLAKSDCYRLLSVKAAEAFGTINSGNPATLDITKFYKFDDGQRPTHYDVGNLTLKPGYFAPDGSIRIVFEYFTHGVGDYFSVDSYANVVPYEKLPVAIRDGLDFRPIMNTTGTAFDGTVTGILKRGYNLSADYSYYLARTDTLSIDSTGNFFITKGVPSTKPVKPNSNKPAMLLATIEMLPYAINTTSNNISLDVIDNKRYTMRDIGALEKRITNVEYYTSLSMLEQETKSLSILDENSLERYKNGFIVDSFSDHGIGATNSNDYMCSIDQDNNELRPQHYVRNIDLIELNVNNAQRVAAGYAITGSVITLPYTNVSMISQPYGSRVKNLNPFAMFTFIGDTKFSPSSDIWFDTKYKPDVINMVEGNYKSTIATLKAAGVLGTVWGAWKNTWTGNQIITSQPKLITRHGYFDKFGKYHEQDTNGADGWINEVNGTWDENDTMDVTTITTKTYARSGINTKVAATYSNTQIDDKIVSTTTIPYMRKKNILFIARGLKPNTRFYPFFDNVAIGTYITPATKLTIASVPGYSFAFDYTKPSGGAVTETARLINGVADNSLSKGDVITGIISGATAVVALQENSATGVVYIYVVNVKGTFAVNETIRGSLSLSRGKITAKENGLVGGSLISNFNGDIIGMFNVPNNAKVKFRTGSRNFRLTTSSNNALTYTSIADNFFVSAGAINIRQKTIESVRNAIVSQERVVDGKTLVTRDTKTLTAWMDPLAQTFLIKQSGGAFLTKVDIFFASKDANVPVRLQIREVENGYPGSNILPFSQVVLTPEKVLLSNVKVNVNSDPVIVGTQIVIPPPKSWYKDTVATSFVFESPVYVKDSTEYCIVLLSDSNNYNVWISQLGDKQIGTNKYISDQPYAGVLFESQNASTWTANQLQDLKFNIYRAKFTTNVTGDVKFTNTMIDYDELETNPLQTTSGSNVVRVYHYNHGMIATDKVTLTNLVIGTSAFNGIPAAQIYTSHVISNVDIDSYTITTTNNATITGMIGGSGLLATYNAKYDSYQVNIQAQEFPEATIDYDIKTTSTLCVKDTVATDIVVDNTINLPTSRIIASHLNEAYKMASAKSLAISARMITTNDSVSPVIDTDRNSMICVTNRINIPSISLNVNPIDYRTLWVGGSTKVTIDEVNNRFQTSDAAIKLMFLTASVGKYINVTGTSAPTTNDDVHIITAIASDGAYLQVGSDLAADTGTDIAVFIADYFIDDIAPINSSSCAKYLTKVINLENNSTSFKVMFAYNKTTAAASIRVYYRIGSSTSPDEFNNKRYTLMTDPGLVSTINSSFSDAAYELSNLSPFTSIQIKIVFMSPDSSKIAKIKDLRVIALA